jgi:hypothetical protein
MPLTPYKHPAGLFEISYPTGWQVDEDDEAVYFGNSSDTLLTIVSFVDVGSEAETGDMERFIDGWFSPEGYGSLDEFERLNQAPQADGSILVEYSFESEGVVSYGNSFFEQHGTVIFVLSFWVEDADDWDSLVPTFGEVANSFRGYAAPSGDEGEWETFRSEVGEYELDYPAGWDVDDFGADAFIGRDDETFMVIVMTTTLPAADPDEAERLGTEEVIAMIRVDDPDAQIDEPGSLFLGDEEGVYVDFVYVDPDTGLQNAGTAVHVVHQGRGYRILIFTLMEDHAETGPLFVEMLSSFRFLD